MFLKPVFCYQNQQEKRGEHVWFPVFFFFFLKNTNSVKKKQISENTKMVFINNSFQKQALNLPIPL